MAVIKNLVRSILPAPVRKKIYNIYVYNFLGRKLANTSKRLDLCAAEIANYFFLCGISEKYPLRDIV